MFQPPQRDLLDVLPTTTGEEGGGGKREVSRAVVIWRYPLNEGCSSKRCKQGGVVAS